MEISILMAVIKDEKNGGKNVVDFPRNVPCWGGMRRKLTLNFVFCGPSHKNGVLNKAIHSFIGDSRESRKRWVGLNNKKPKCGTQIHISGKCTCTLIGRSGRLQICVPFPTLATFLNISGADEKNRLNGKLN